LMVRSGQAVTEGEYARKLIAMIPLPTDNPDTTAIKRDAFDTAQKAILRLAGGAAPATAAPAATTAATAPAAGQMSPEDRAASIANAKAAIAKAPGKRDAILQKLQSAIPDLNPDEVK